VVRRGHIVLGAVVLGIVLTLIGSSFYALQTHEAERQSLLSEEADAAAMVFAQRDSFGVVLALDGWARGSLSSRDVQVTRAVLGKRLSVVTAAGATTFELTGSDYADSLVAIDAVIRSLSSVPDDERGAVRQSVSPAVNEFVAETRLLTLVFREILAEEAQNALAERAAADLLQGVSSLIALVLGVTLGLWILVDINRSFRVSSRQLTAESARLEFARQRLDLARRRLDFRQTLDAAARQWNEALSTARSVTVLAEYLILDLQKILAGVVVELVTPGRGIEAPPHLRIVAGGAVPTADDDDAASALERANEVLGQLWLRLSSEADFQTRLNTDGLTGLPNRRQLDSLLAAAIAQVRPPSVATIALVKLLRFSEFNSTFTHTEGDHLLVDVAQRLQTACPAFDVLRLAGGEFAIIAALPGEHAARNLAATIETALAFERAVGNESVVISASVGIALARNLDDASDLLMRQATTALALARSQGARPRIALFNPETDGARLATLSDESALRSALRSGEFRVHFQPLIRLHDGAVAGAEALVRWQRPEGDFVFPGDFLPMMAKAGLLIDLGWQVIDEALEGWSVIVAEARASERDLSDAYVSINVDAEQCAVPSLAQHIVAAVARHGLAPHNVMIEVTEHVLLEGDVALAQLAILRREGIRIALDDFGTGYSSLAQATALPLDVLKIDRAFIPPTTMTDQAAALIRDIVSIAATLNVSVTAEGVESLEVANALPLLGVQVAQGWLYSKALPVDDLRQWLVAR
jgi:diguanylate cyclase (GGDEF)-like protein